MRAKHFLRKINETAGDGAVANAVVAEVIKLIGEGHTEVSPDVITTKVSAALGKPFMLKDLVAANNSSPELQHYIDSINPTKIKFSTDILTVKNQDPVKEKEKSEAGVASMAARAAGRSRLGESIHSQGYQIDLDTENNQLVFSRDGVVVHKERASAGKGRPSGTDTLKKRISAVIEKLEDTLDPTGLAENEISVTGGPVKPEKGYYSVWTRKPGSERWNPVTKYPDEHEANQVKKDLERQGHEVIVRESLRPGETHVWTVHFDDGTKSKLHVPSDEVSFQQIKDFFAKKGKVAVEVDYSWDVHGSDQVEPDPAQRALDKAQDQQRNLDRALAAQDRKVPEGVAEGSQQFKKHEPYWVCVNGKKWKHFKTYQQARNVHDKLEKKLRSEGSNKKVSLLADLDEASWVDGKIGDPKDLVWKQTGMSYEAAVKEFGKENVRKEGKARDGHTVIAVLVPRGPLEEGLKDPADNPCWKGYKPVGTKKKGGKTVPNCVPKESQELEEKWSKKYKDSINCSNPKGFSQRAHCAGKKK